MNRLCVGCGKEFKPKHGKQKHCTGDCRAESEDKRIKPPDIMINGVEMFNAEGYFFKNYTI